MKICYLIINELERLLRKSHTINQISSNIFSVHKKSKIPLTDYTLIASIAFADNLITIYTTGDTRSVLETTCTYTFDIADPSFSTQQMADIILKCTVALAKISFPLDDGGTGHILSCTKPNKPTRKAEK